MAAVTKGTAHVWGIGAGVGAIANATVLSFNIDDEHANVGQTVNEIGNKIEDRRDDLTKTGTITLKIRTAYTVAAAATQLTYNSVLYLITKVGRAEQSGDFVVITYSILTSEFVTLV
jgi:hypothetical protein